MSCLFRGQTQHKHWHNTFPYMDLPLFHQCWKDYSTDGRSFTARTFKHRFINLAPLTYIEIQNQTANANGKSQVLSTLQNWILPLTVIQILCPSNKALPIVKLEVWTPAQWKLERDDNLAQS